MNAGVENKDWDWDNVIGNGSLNRFIAKAVYPFFNTDFFTWVSEKQI